MNSIPLISHHLFVAAVRNEGRSQERPRKAPAASDSAAHPRPARLDAAEDSRPFSAAARPLRVSGDQARR